MHDLDAYIARLKATPELAALLGLLFDLVERQNQRIVELEAQISALQARLDLNSTNSHKPPSSDRFKKTKPAVYDGFCCWRISPLQSRL